MAAVSISQQDKAEGHAALKRRAAIASVATSLAMAVVKLAAGAASGSLALLSEGAHNAIDIGASSLTFFAIRAADQPADADHPFGHAKIEAVAALAETGFLAVLAVGVAALAAERIFADGETVAVGPFAIGAITASIVADLVRWRALKRVANTTGSQALAADALHFSSDLVSSVLVLAGLLLTRLGVAHADALAAIGVAVFIAIAGFRLGRATIDALVDRAPAGLTEALRAVTAHVQGVASVDDIRLRSTGAAVVGDILVSVSRTLPLERVAAIKSDIAQAVASRYPRAELRVTANPIALDDETILERVTLTAARRRLPVHHITIQRIGERRTVTVDLEVDGRMSLGKAHEIASGLESAIANEIGADIEIDTHIEPAEVNEVQGRAADPELARRIELALSESAARGGRLRNVHKVRARTADDGVYVVFHCRADPEASVEAVHGDVDALERSVYAAFPEVKRVVGHAEPARIP
jgi:cation diffusion facilitator family transporter